MKKTLPSKAPPRKMIWQKTDMGVLIPQSGSTACIQYVTSFRQINSFLEYVLRMVGHIEHVSKHLHDTLLEVTDEPKEKEKLTKEWAERRGPLHELKNHRQFFVEVILVRHVENYLNYLSSLLMEIFLARPEVLRSSDRIELETVLRHDSIEDLVRTVAERKVDSLSYASFADLSDFFAERFHVDLIPDSDRSLVIDAIETRNISVHNRCVINQRYVTRTKIARDKIGTIRVVGIDWVEKVISTLANSVIAVDKDARQRLKVKGHRFPKPKASTK